MSQSQNMTIATIGRCAHCGLIGKLGQSCTECNNNNKFVDINDSFGTEIDFLFEDEEVYVHLPDSSTVVVTKDNFEQFKEEVFNNKK